MRKRKTEIEGRKTEDRSQRTEDGLSVETLAKAKGRRSGFTLVEMLLAVTISVIVFSAMGMVLTRCFSLWQDASAHWRLAQHARISRERILRGGFADPSGGLLCATNVNIVGTSSALNVGYATESNFYGVCAYTNIIQPRMYLLDQNDISPYWVGGHTDWGWGVRSGKKMPIPDVEVVSMTAEQNGALLTIAYRLRFSAAGKEFTQPHTIRAYLVNQE